MRRFRSGPGSTQRGTTFELRLGLRWQTLFAIDRSEHAVKTSNLWRQAYRPFKLGLGKHELIESGVRFPQEFMGFGVCGGECGGLPKVRQGCIGTILIEERISHIDRGAGVFGGGIFVPGRRGVVCCDWLRSSSESVLGKILGLC